MTPQSTFTVVAEIDPAREAELRRLLAAMNHRPGVFDPDNALVPLGRFDRLHFARFVVLDDPTGRDIEAYGLPATEYPQSLAFVGDVDGPRATFLDELAERAGPGLRQVFACCRGFDAHNDLRRWMESREQRPAAAYGNWRGRTVRQVREEELLRRALSARLDADQPRLSGLDASEVHRELRAFAEAEQQSGRLTLSRQAPTPLGWWVRNFLHLAGVPLLMLLLAPMLLLYLPIFAFQLRRRERTDPVIAPPVDPEWARGLAEIEDHDVTNQFNAIGAIKPGRFRRLTIAFLLWAIDYTARHVYNRGHLARVSTIHFARWVFLDGKRRVLFCSNYDGSLESYMDDFINKVGWGLNLVFSNGIGYPRTNWLLFGGCKDEQTFKRLLRRHQPPSQVWYRAEPGLSAVDLQRNTRIREGIEQPALSQAAARDWLRLF